MATEDDSDVPETGAVFTFGKSRFGDNTPSKFWIRNDKVSHTSCGDEHTALVADSGRVFMFGSNSWGQLGLAHTNEVNKPSRVKALKGEKVLLVACGRSHTIFATESGKLYSCGNNAEGQLGLNSTVDRVEKPTELSTAVQTQYTMLSAGADHSAALTESGEVYVWGGGSEGQLGLGEDTTEVSAPTHLKLDEPAVCISCGYYHTAVVTESGKLFTFGEVDDGKLGLGDDTEGHMEPGQVTSIRGRVKWVACGGSHTVAITEDGRAYTFGNGSNGQLGHGNTNLEVVTPEEISWPAPTKVHSAACGENHTALITDRGYMYSCGDGRHGKLAQGDENFANQFRPTHVARFTHFFVEKVACGGCHMLTLSRPRNDSDDAVTNGDDRSEEDEDVSEQNAINRMSLKYPMPDLTASMDLSGSISARNRRREKLPDPSGTLNRTLPPLNSSISNKSSLPPLNGGPPSSNGPTNPLDRGLLPTIDLPHNKSDKIEMESDEDDMREERNAIKANSVSMVNSAPSPKPRAPPRKGGSSPDQDSGTEEVTSDTDRPQDDDETKDDSHHSDNDDNSQSEMHGSKPVPSSRRVPELHNKKHVKAEGSEGEELDGEEAGPSMAVHKPTKVKVKEDTEESDEEDKATKKKDKKKKEKPAKKKRKVTGGLFGRKKLVDSEEEEESEEESDEGAKTKKKKTPPPKGKKKKKAEESEDEEEAESEVEKEGKSGKAQKAESENEDSGGEDDDKKGDSAKTGGKEEKDEKKPEEKKKSKLCTIL